MVFNSDEEGDIDAEDVILHPSLFDNHQINSSRNNSFWSSKFINIRNSPIFIRQLYFIIVIK